MPTAITVPVSQLQDPVVLPASPSPQPSNAPGKPISVPVSQLAEPATSTQQASSTPTAQQPSLGQKVWQGAKQSMIGQTVQSVITPPQSAAEHVVNAVGGTQALVGYRAAKSLVDSAESMLSPKKNGQDFQQSAEDFRRASQDFHTGNWRSLASDVVSSGSDILGQAVPYLKPGTERVRELSEGARPGGNLATPVTKDVLDIGTTLAGVRGAGAGEGAAPAEAAETETAAQAPSKLRQVLSGQKVEQAPAQSALRQAAGAGNDVQGIRTFLDKPLADLAQTERATYDTINKAAGTDLKALYDHAEEVTDALDDPTNITNRSDLQKDLAQTRAQIEDGESKALANGVPPDTLDKAISLTQKRYAGEEVAKKLFNNENIVTGNKAFGTDETVDVTKAIKAAENLNKPSRFAPRGTPPRLQQWLGKDGANNLLQQLYDSRDAGQQAVRLRTILKRVGIGLVGVGGTEEALRRL